MRVGISLTRRTPLHDRIITLIREVWAHTIALPLLPMLSQESRHSCICVLGVSIMPLLLQFLIGFWDCSSSVAISVFHFTSNFSIIFFCRHVYPVINRYIGTPQYVHYVKPRVDLEILKNQRENLMNKTKIISLIWWCFYIGCDE